MEKPFSNELKSHRRHAKVMGLYVSRFALTLFAQVCGHVCGGAAAHGVSAGV